MSRRVHIGGWPIEPCWHWLAGAGDAVACGAEDYTHATEARERVTCRACRRAQLERGAGDPSAAPGPPAAAGER